MSIEKQETGLRSATPSLKRYQEVSALTELIQNSFACVTPDFSHDTVKEHFYLFSLYISEKSYFLLRKLSLRTKSETDHLDFSHI